MEITALIAICKTTLDEGTRIYAAIRKRNLSDKERELLVHAARDGAFHILGTDFHGPWVRAGTKDFFEQSDRAHQAFYLDAFRSLCERGFVRHEGGHLFRLTGAGFAMARKIAGESAELTDQESR
jgi:hypothetical protein